MDPKYGPPNNLGRRNHGEIMGKSWGIHGNAFRMTGKLEIYCRPKSGYYACNLSARLTGKAARGARLQGKAAGQGYRARLPGKATMQGFWARLPGKASGQGCQARVQGCIYATCRKLTKFKKSKNSGSTLM
jgi:hypothetical protein